MQHEEHWYAEETATRLESRQLLLVLLLVLVLALLLPQ